MDPQAKNLHNVFEKINDLKSLFRFGERMIPIITSLVDFMREMVPLLENINHSISESASKMPQATNQIADVTQATEMATTQILDRVDEISNSCNSIEKYLNRKEESAQKRRDLLQNLLMRYENEPEIVETVTLLKELENGSAEREEIIKILGKISDDTYQITMALQVQDITAQQLAAVNHLIDSVRVKLSSLIIDISEAQLDDQIAAAKMEMPEGVHFDPNASFTDTVGKQDAVDSIFANAQQEKASQDEIDKLFR